MADGRSYPCPDIQRFLCPNNVNIPHFGASGYWQTHLDIPAQWRAEQFSVKDKLESLVASPPLVQTFPRPDRGLSHMIPRSQIDRYGRFVRAEFGTGVRVNNASGFLQQWHRLIACGQVGWRPLSTYGAKVTYLCWLKPGVSGV